MTTDQTPMSLTQGQLASIADAAYMELDRQDDHDLVHDLANRGNGYIRVGGDVNLPALVRAVLEAAVAVEDVTGGDPDSDDVPQPKYPDVRVRLTGEDGNGFFIATRVTRALRLAGVASEIRDEFVMDALSGDYAHLLETVGEWVTIADDGMGD